MPFSGPAYVLVQHAPPVVAAGEPLDGTSPGSGSRQPATGGAGPSPLANDSGSVPGRKDGRIMREVLGVWKKLKKIFCGTLMVGWQRRDQSKKPVTPLRLTEGAKPLPWVRNGPAHTNP